MSQLAIIARRLAKKGVYIKKLDVIDELGATTVVATDKTGSLTQNSMVVTDLWYNRRHHAGIIFIKIFIIFYSLLQKKISKNFIFSLNSLSI